MEELPVATEEAKSFLYQWLGKNKVVPEYNVRAAGTKQRQRFLCELVVQGFPYRGAGNSTSKKDAQTNAAKDFIQFLVRSGKIVSQELPQSVLAFTPTVPDVQIPMENQANFSKPVFPGGRGPREMGEGYRPHTGGRFGPDFDAINAKSMSDAESLDINCKIHGNWTIDNSKSRLHQFLQTNNIKADYSYSAVGPAHAKSFQCELHFFVKQLGRGLQARETGSNKQSASKSCALSLVRQLYHLKVIEPFEGATKRNKEADSLQPYEVSVDPNLMTEVHGVLQQLNITPPAVIPSEETPKQEEGQSEPVGVTLLSDLRKDLPFLNAKEDSGDFSVVSWSPPMPNWNPWTSTNIDEGHMASASLDQLSSEFLQSVKEVQQTNSHYQELFATRSRLPVYEARERIMSAISDNPIILVKGDTGSGKTTQICQFILDDYLLAEMGAHCNVVITQPRRISAISVAERVAAERAEDLGQTIGYSVRFESCLPRPYASILFCTVGVLLRKLEAGLRGVSHVIVDEIHERDVNTDFLLVVLRDMLSVYPELRVILMSATIDDTLFTQYFNGCPVVVVEGRAFPVQTYFIEDVVEQLHFMPSPDSIRTARKNKNNEDDDLSMATDASDENLNILPPGIGYSETTRRALSLISEKDVNLELLVALLNHISEMQADQDYKSSVLIFLPGWNLIFLVLKYLMSHPIYGSQSYAVLPLHSQLPREDQHRVFDPVPPRITKIILSTNIAETSITIDDVGFVVDYAKQKTKLFTSHNNMTTFVTMWASKCNLLQRRGRAGRVQAGVCFHLCSRARFERMDESMTPEILRTPLHEIALMIKLLRLGGIAHFLSKAPEPPPLDAVIEAQALLYELNCLDNNGELTGLGRILAKLPLDPRLGKMIVLGIVFGCADPLAILAANTSNMNEVFNLGVENRRLTPTQRAFAAHRHSDHFAVLNAFQQWSHHESKGEQAEIEFCQQRMLSLPSLRMTRDAKNQLLQVLSSIGFPEEHLSPLRLTFRDDSIILDNIAALLVSGLYPNVCYHKEKRKVLTTEAKAALVHKASVNCSKFEIEFPYPFFIFGEKIRTRAVSCKQMTNVSPLHLLLFGSRRVEAFPENIVRLDNWLNLRMNPEDAAAIISLKGPIENLVIKASEDPEGFFPLIPEDEALVGVVSHLSRLAAAQHGLENQSYVKSRNKEIDYHLEIAEMEYMANYESQDQDTGAELEGSNEFAEDEDGSNLDDQSGMEEDPQARGQKRSLDEYPEGNGSFGQGGGPPAKMRYFNQGNGSRGGQLGNTGTVPRQPFTPRGGGFNPVNKFSPTGCSPSPRGGGFNPVNKFSPRGYSPSPRGGTFSQGFSGGRGGQSQRGNFSGQVLRSGPETTPTGGYGVSRFGSRPSSQPPSLMSLSAPTGFEPKQRFFSSNRGGWSARGNASRGGFRGNFQGGRPRQPNRSTSFRPQNYPY